MSSKTEARRPMAAFYILSAVIFLQFLAGGTSHPFMVLYAQELGADLIQISWIVGSTSAIGLLASFFWGRFADKVGRRKPFVVGAVGTLVITSLLMANATDWWMLLPLRIVEGIASGAYQIGNMAMMGDILEGHPRRARMIGFYRMSGSLAFAVAIVIAGFVAQSSGFHTTYMVAAGIYLTSFAFSLALPEAKRTAGAAGTARVEASYFRLLRGPMLPLVIIAASYSIPFSGVYSVWSVWVDESMGLGRAVFSQLWGLAAFVEVPAMFLDGLIGDRYGRRVPFLAGLSLFAVVYCLYIVVPLTAVPLVIGLAVAQVVRGFALAFYTASAMTMAIEIPPPEARGRASGLFQISQSLAGITGSYSGGFVAQTFGYPTLFAAAAAFVAVGAAYVRTAIASPARKSAVEVAPVADRSR